MTAARCDLATLACLELQDVTAVPGKGNSPMVLGSSQALPKSRSVSLSLHSSAASKLALNRLLGVAVLAVALNSSILAV